MVMRFVVLFCALILNAPFAMAVLPDEDDIEANVGAGPNVDPADNVEDIGEAAPSSATPQPYGPMSELEALNDCAEVTLTLRGCWQKEGEEVSEIIEVDLRQLLDGHSNFLCASLGGLFYDNIAVEEDWLGSSVASLFQGVEEHIFRTSEFRDPAFGLPPEDADLYLAIYLKALHKLLPSGIDLSTITGLVLPRDYVDLGLLLNVSMPNLRNLVGRSGIDHFPRHLVEGSRITNGEIPERAFALNWYGMYAVPLWMQPYIEAGHLRLDVGDYMWGSTGHDCLGWRDVQAMDGFITRDDPDLGVLFSLGYFEKGQENPHLVPAHRPLRPFEVQLACAKDTEAASPAADLKAPHNDALEEEKTGPLNILDLPPEIWEEFFRNLNNAERLTLLAACPDHTSSFLAVGLEGIMFHPTGGLPSQPRADRDPLAFLGDALDVFGRKPLIHDDDFTFSIAWPARNKRDVILLNDSAEVVRTDTPFDGLSLLQQSQRMVYETSLAMRGRFRFEPIFGQKKYQEFWEQATAPCPEGTMLAMHKEASGFSCKAVDTKTLEPNLTVIRDYGRLSLVCDHVGGIGEAVEFNEHKAEVATFVNALSADVKYFEIFMDYVRDDGEEVLQTYGPCHMGCVNANMPSLPVLKEMCRALARHKIDNQRYLQNHILKMALGNDLMALAQAFPSTILQPKGASEAQPAETIKDAL